MREGRASRTAEHNALFRAIESWLPERRRLFEDPLARRFLTWPLSLVPPLARVPGLREILLRFIDARWPGVRSALVARTRLIDATLEARLGRGIEQLVILGAGFDTRAYRLAGLERLAVFEVDHPDTQARKRRALARVFPALPKHVRLVASDFERRDLESVLGAAGYRETARSFILWEGVTGYLREAAVDSTLRWCARASAGSLLLFTYLHRDVLTRPDAFVGTPRLFAALERAGESFRFGIEPSELPGRLARHGLVLERDVAAAAYRRLYFGEAARRMRGHEFYRVALARVARPEPAW